MCIQIEHLSFSYGNKIVLHDISFTVEEGQFISILGPNGVGKSTLFRCILGLLHKFSGTIRIDDKNIRSMSERELAKRIAFIPQTHYSSFHYSVLDMVLMGSTNQLSSIGVPGMKQEREAVKALEMMGITDLKERSYHQISGGEQQLVLMARALLQNARIWILDEPAANLDYGNQIKVLSRLKAMSKAGYLILQSTHNPDQTYLFSDRILALQHGKLIAQGRPEDIFTEELISQLYGVDIKLQKLYDDRIRVCIPVSVIETSRSHNVVTTSQSLQAGN